MVEALPQERAADVRHGYGAAGAGICLSAKIVPGSVGEGSEYSARKFFPDVDWKVTRMLLPMPARSRLML